VRGRAGGPRRPRPASSSSTPGKATGPDLTDAPADESSSAAIRRCASAAAGPMGRILVRGEAGHDIIPGTFIPKQARR